MHRSGHENKAAMAKRVLCVASFLVVVAVAPWCSALEEGAMAAASIEEACRKAASRHAGVTYEHCVSSLASDRRSRDAVDLHALAVVATKIAIEHVASTEARMDDLSEAEESAQARARLDHCLELYNAAADVLRDALDNLHAHVYGKATEQLAAALGASESCEDAWKGSEERGPVAAHDREYGRMALLALGLTSGIL